jgi:hypothetical protein
VASKDSRTFYYVVDGELADADVGIDSYGTAQSSLKFSGGKFTTDNLYFIEQLQSFADTAGHPVSTESPRSQEKKGNS